MLRKVRALHARVSDVLKRPVPSALYRERHKHSIVLPLRERILGPSPWKGQPHATLRRLSVALCALILCGSVVIVFYHQSASARERTFDSGILAMRAADYADAQRLLKVATEQNPSNALAFYELGNAAYLLGDEVEALKCWAEAFRLDPSMDQAYIARGIYYYNKGDFKASLRDFNEAVLLMPSVQSYFQRGMTHQALGEHGLALYDFDRAMTHANYSEVRTIEKSREVSLTALKDGKLSKSRSKSD